jgi:hypothetical protein
MGAASSIFEFLLIGLPGWSRHPAAKDFDSG